MYTATKTPYGTYQIKKDGMNISTVSESGLANFGLSPTQLSSSVPAPTAIGTQATTQAQSQYQAAGQTATPPTTQQSSQTSSGGQTETYGSVSLEALPHGPADIQRYKVPEGYNISGDVTIGGQQFQYDAGTNTLIKRQVPQPVGYPDISTYKAQPSGTSGTETTQIGYDQNLSKYGITQDMWNKGNDTQRAVWSAILSSTNLLNQTPISSITMQDALNAAQNDPTITAQFSDAFNIDRTQFNQTLEQIKQATSTQAQQYQTQFENERKQLAEAKAAAGQAYSGFRGKAQEDLSQIESGIVTSSRAQLQKNLQDLTTSFESKYGTQSTTPASAIFFDPFAGSRVSISGQTTTPATSANESISGQLAGGITGSQNIAKQQAVNAAAAQNYQLGVIS